MSFMVNLVIAAEGAATDVHTGHVGDVVEIQQNAANNVIEERVRQDAVFHEMAMREFAEGALAFWREEGGGDLSLDAVLTATRALPFDLPIG